MTSPTDPQQKKDQHRFGNLLTEDLKEILEESFKDLLAIFVACLEPEEVRHQKADWIAQMLRSTTDKLQKAAEQMQA